MVEEAGDFVEFVTAGGGDGLQQFDVPLFEYLDGSIVVCGELKLHLWTRAADSSGRKGLK